MSINTPLQRAFIGFKRALLAVPFLAGPLFCAQAFSQIDYSFSQCSPTFTDISGTGTKITDAEWGGDIDDGEANVSLPFLFTLYNTQSTQIRIGTNGGILFGATTGTLPFTNTDIPTGNPAPTILPFWDDLNLEGGNPPEIGVYYETLGTAPNRRFIIQWHQVHHYNQTGNVTFQAVLYEGSNEINFIYNSVDFGDPSFNAGQSATIGLNNDASEAHKFSFNTVSLGGVNGICFVVVPTGTDLALTKTANPNPVQAGQNLNYTLTITNNGPVTAPTVVVTDTLPAGVTWVSTVPSQGSCSSPSGVSCELGALTSGASATVTIVVTVN